MKNEIHTAKDDNGKFAVFLWTYHNSPSGSIRSMVRISSQFVFDTAEQARQHLIDHLDPLVLANTDVVLEPTNQLPTDSGLCESVFREIDNGAVRTSAFNVGDVVEVIPEMLSEITDTNKPDVGSRYVIRSVFSGETWKFGLNNYPDGKNANIYIQSKHIKIADLSKTICWVCKVRFDKTDVDLCNVCREKYSALLEK